MNAGSSVLIVDRSTETRLVLRTALERRGMRVWEARRADVGLTLARKHRPNLIVLDLEAVEADRHAAGEFTAAAENAGGTLIVLGSARRLSATPCDEFVSKPYHYQPLILRIEELLRERHGRTAA